MSKKEKKQSTPEEKEKKQSTPEEQEKKLREKQNAKRGRYVQYNLYPDNPAMMRFFEWLTGHRYIGNGAYTVTGSAHMASGCWILHEPEKDEKKYHIHVMCYFEQTHSQKSYAKLGGQCEYQKHGDDFIYDRDLFEPDIYTVVTDTLKPKLNAQVIEDPPTFLLYMTHETFAARQDGKKQYDRSLLHWFGNVYTKIMDLYGQTEVNNHQIEFDLMELAPKCTNLSDFTRILISNGMIRHMEFIRKNPYFVKIFILGGLK